MVLNFPFLPFCWFQYMNMMALKAGPELISEANSWDQKDWSSSLMLLSPQLFHKMLTQCHDKIFINSLILTLNNYVMQSEWGGSIGDGLLRIQMGALCSWTQLIELESCGGGSGGWGDYGDHGLHDINASWWMLSCGCVSFLLIFFYLFLVVPLQGTMDRWSWVYLTLTIVQNPSAHCANCENHYVLEHVGYTNLAHCAPSCSWKSCQWAQMHWGGFIMFLEKPSNE